MNKITIIFVILCEALVGMNELKENKRKPDQKSLVISIPFYEYKYYRKNCFWGEKNYNQDIYKSCGLTDTLYIFVLF